MPKKLRIAFHPHFGRIVQHDVAREVEKAVGAFKDMGHEITVLDDTPVDLSRAWQRVGGTQALATLHDWIEKHREDFGRAYLSGVEAASNITWKHYGAAYRERAQFNQWCERVFGHFDLLLTPTLPIEAFPAKGPHPSEINGIPVDVMGTVVFTHPFNMSGHPAASVRAGFTDAGLPCGLQIVAERYREDLVLQASYAYEQARPWNDKWPEI